jgi:hypothetical protein
LAIITGRTVADVSHRLGFAPRFIVGNHGAEVPGQVPTFDPAPLDALRTRIRAHAAELRAARIRVEDKRYFLALHYRRARDQRRALARIEALCSGLDPALRLLAANSWSTRSWKPRRTRATRSRRWSQRAGCGTALFARRRYQRRSGVRTRPAQLADGSCRSRRRGVARGVLCRNHRRKSPCYSTDRCGYSIPCKEGNKKSLHKRPFLDVHDSCGSGVGAVSVAIRRRVIVIGETGGAQQYARNRPARRLSDEF